MKRIKMLTLHEFVEFLKYLTQSKKESDKRVLKEILDPSRLSNVEWLDAQTETIEEKIYILSHHTFKEGKLTAEQRDQYEGDETLSEKMEIDLNDWLQRATSLGLPLQM